MGESFTDKNVPLTRVFSPRERFSAGEHIKGELMLSRMKEFERIEKHADSIRMSEWHPRSVGEVERRAELELIGRVIGLLERVVPERFGRVHKEKKKAA